MVALKPGSTILVTGASGYVAAHVCRELLKAGFIVKGTVRSDSKGKYLANLLGDDGEFSYIVVEDIEQPEAFDEAVKGVDGVAHTASPFHFKFNRPHEIIGPAIEGTTNVLKSIEKYNPDVKRVVVTSSCASVLSMSSPDLPYTYTEDDWNNDAPANIALHGDSIGEVNGGSMRGSVYCGSKVMAERAFWDFAKHRKPQWDGVVMNPSLVLGPLIHECESPEKLNTSCEPLYKWLTGQNTEKDLSPPPSSFVHVVDLALAHVKAFTLPEAGGHRFILSTDNYAQQDYLDVRGQWDGVPANAKADSPQAVHRGVPELAKNAIKGTSGEGRRKCDPSQTAQYDHTKAEHMLGITFTPWDDTIVQQARSLYERFPWDLPSE